MWKSKSLPTAIYFVKKLFQSSNLPIGIRGIGIGTLEWNCRKSGFLRSLHRSVGIAISIKSQEAGGGIFIYVFFYL